MKKFKIIAVLIFVWSVISLIRNASIFSFSGLDLLEILLTMLIELLCLTTIRDIFKYKQPRYVILFSAYCCLISFFFSNNVLMDLRCVLWWPCIYAYFYTIFRSELVTESSLKLYFLLLFSVIASLYVYSKIINPISYTIQGQEYFYTSSFVIFYVVTLLPIVFLQKQIIRYIIIAVAIISALYSFKRSVIIVSVLIFTLSLLYDVKSENRNIKQCFLLAVSIFGFYKLSQKIDSNVTFYVVDRFSGIEDGGGSGRTNIYSLLISNYFGQEPLYMLFGRGYNSVIKYQNINDDGVIVSAHNDYLEFLFDYGIIGFVFYVFFTINILKHVYQCKEQYRKYYGVAIFISFLIFSLISHLALYPTYICYLMIMIGMFEGTMDRDAYICKKYGSHY